MRPEILFGLFAPVTSLAGIGPKVGKLVEKAIGPHVVDVLWHFPRDLVDRRFRPTVAEAPSGRIATLTLTVDHHEAAPSRGRRPYRVIAHDDSGSIALVFFHANADYLNRALPPGQTRIVSGTVEHFRDQVQMSHPDFIVRPEEAGSLPAIEPVYPLTGGLSPKVLSRAVGDAIGRAPALPEWLDPAYLKREGFPDWKTAVQSVHAPTGFDDLSPQTNPRRRLAYDELLANQLALAVIRMRMRKLPGRSIKGDGKLRRRILDALPFTLTASQKQALREINDDMAAEQRMLRLLQGDVGSGKTVVALFAMLNAVECSGQAVLMAPTEILARQHFQTIDPLLLGSGVTCALLTGRDKASDKKRVMAGLADGSIDIAIGTHALFQKDVAFKNLTLSVVDEQHRFGVHQRLDLAEKGKAVDSLVMTATPIPRTLLLTAYGDLDASRLTDKPPGRLPVTTRTVAHDRLLEVIAAVRRAMNGGARIYWVCPLVEELEIDDRAAAEARYAALQKEFGDAVALVHGRLGSRDKEEAMRRFSAGEAKILVATTVIEVGVNVPEATVMVIEHAERFGLAQLHQLRGRVGRGDKPSTCLLVYGAPLSETAAARLRIMRETEDGFRIAEEDLRLRGGGEVLGTRQSGLPQFRLADPAEHGDLLAVASDDAKLILDRDPALESARGKALRVLLYLFERDAAVVTLRSG